MGIRRREIILEPQAKMLEEISTKDVRFTTIK